MSRDTENGSPCPEQTVVVTGAGGPAGIAVIRALLHQPRTRVIAADMSALAAGLYLVGEHDRWIVPAGTAADFTATLLSRAIRENVTVVVPTVDCELEALSAVRARFQAAGIQLALPSSAALAASLDKLKLSQVCTGWLPVPRTELLDGWVVPESWEYPVMVKPRWGSGSRGVRTLASAAELGELQRQPAGEDLIVQEYLPGDEFSVDVIADLEGHIIAAVPRSRLRVDSGVAVAGQTLHDAELESLARAAVTALGLTLVCNVQCRRDRAGKAKLLEVNPRFPGSMPLTVASGVNMPVLMLDLMMGRAVPSQIRHRSVMNVRFLEDRFISAEDAAPLMAHERVLAGADPVPTA
jgi:carbamoyl-phosphate synthase large subunit